MIRYTEQGGTLTFTVRAQPRASRSVIAGEIEGALKIKVAAPPVDGAANEALIHFLAQVFDVPRRAVTILSGATAKTKIVQIQGLTRDHFEATLAATLTPDT